MEQQTVSFSSSTVDFIFAPFSSLRKVVSQKAAVLLTDENVWAAHRTKFRGWRTIVVKAGEVHKVQATVDDVIAQLVALGADRQTTLVGVGGGVVTDLAGYVASIFLRGVPFGFVPTTLLGLVDASIGGKNGIDVGPYKNMVGTIRQPRFLLHDYTLLQTLPVGEWRNGFAEIIKHAAIKDAALFRELAAHDFTFYQKKKKELAVLIRRNALLKSKVVQKDEWERGERRLLNFGHTLGHAIETPYGLLHGEAVAIGMAFAARLSEDLLGFKKREALEQIIEQYGLPTSLSYDKEQVAAHLQKDKKKERDFIHFILLRQLGKGVIQPISFKQLYAFL